MWPRSLSFAIDPAARVRGDRSPRRAAWSRNLLAAEAEALDPAYFQHRRTGRPRVTLKAALTLDGQLAASDRSSQWITGEAARDDGHRLRAQFDAVMVGSGTVISDNPQLDVRITDYAGPQPRPIVPGRNPDLPRAQQNLQRNRCWSPVESWKTTRSDPISSRTGRGPLLDEGSSGHCRRGYLDVLVEGGPDWLESLERGLWIGESFYWPENRRWPGVRPV